MQAAILFLLIIYKPSFYSNTTSFQSIIDSRWRRLECFNLLHLLVRHHEGEHNYDRDEGEDGEDDPGKVADDPSLLPPGERGFDHYLPSPRPAINSRGIQANFGVSLKI